MPLNTRKGVLTGIALLLASVAANAAIVATVDFTGVALNYATGNFATIPVGAPVSGTYTFNFAVPDLTATPGSGAIGSNGYWGAETSCINDCAGAPLPFTATIKVGSSTFSGPTVNANPPDRQDESLVSYLVDSKGMPYYTAEDTVVTANGDETDMSFQLYPEPNGSLPYLSNGLPSLATGVSGFGHLTEIAGDTDSIIDFQLTSLTVTSIQAVPLPSPVWLILAALASLGVTVRRRIPRNCRQAICSIRAIC